MNLDRRTVGAIAAGVVVVCSAGVVVTADHSASDTARPNGTAHGAYVDDKDDDSEDVARDRRTACIFAEQPGCPRS